MILTPGRATHVSWSGDLPRRLSRLLASSYTVKSSLAHKLQETSSTLECWPTGSRLESLILMYELAKRYFPTDYLVRLRLRLPWFVGLTQDVFPRLVTVSRTSAKTGPLFGPFSDRDSTTRYQEAVLNLFQLRRCTEVLEPSPDHPGCIYGEMNQCLRPCQCVVSSSEYRSESERVSEFLLTNGRSAIASLSASRDRAAAQTDFETAGALHKQIEKRSAAAAERNEVIANLATFSGVALTRGLAKRHYRLWPMVNGQWQAPHELDFSIEGANIRSLDARVRELLGETLTSPRTDGIQLEEVAIFSRWYYASYREGDWFPFRTLDDLNYRKLVRAISNLVRSDTISSPE